MSSATVAMDITEPMEWQSSYQAEFTGPGCFKCGSPLYVSEMIRATLFARLLYCSKFIISDYLCTLKKANKQTKPQRSGPL